MFACTRSPRFPGLDARIHPAWPIMAMLGGFALWWPLGLIMLALWQGAGMARAGLGRGPGLGRGLMARGHRWSPAGTGNTAFDAHRDAVLQRLEAERRALDDQQREFAGFLDQLKCARDREEFDRFMDGRGADAAWGGAREGARPAA